MQSSLNNFVEVKEDAIVTVSISTLNFTHFKIFLEKSLILHQQVILLRLWAAWAAEGRLNKNN